MHKAGFVNIVGNPNVGKSTLMNMLVGQHISIATFKAQTTRHRIIGILNDEDSQIVFSDTPGVLTPAYRLQEQMLRASHSALEDADILLYVTDVVESPDKQAAFLDKVSHASCPLIVLINKIDLSNQQDVASKIQQWSAALPNAEVMPISALHKFGVNELLARIRQLLPPSPAYFDKDQLTDRPARFFVTEIIREKILRYYDKEIPYAVEVRVDEYNDTPTLLRITATIVVERDSQKAIIIGHEGLALKRVSTEARRALQRFFGKPVYLRATVKVDKDWRNSPQAMKAYGYDND